MGSLSDSSCPRCGLCRRRDVDPTAIATPGSVASICSWIRGQPGRQRAVQTFNHRSLGDGPQLKRDPRVQPKTDESGRRLRSVPADCRLDPGEPSPARPAPDTDAAASEATPSPVNNAGVFPNILVMNMETDDFAPRPQRQLARCFLCTRFVAKHMIERNHGGRIINITSIDALHPSSAGLAHYDASKHGVWGFTKNIALELAPHQIWVNAIAPGGIATPGVQQAQAGAQLPEGVDMTTLLEAFLGRIPMARMGEPDDIGKVALFLASDLSSYMTGSQIVVDGGVLLS